MHCQDKLELYLLEALEPKESSDVREHLSSCESCASEMKRLETLVGALHQVRTAYESGGGVSVRRVRSFRSWKPWAAAAAILVAAIPAVFWALPETAPTPPSIVSKPETPPPEKKPLVVAVDEETHMTFSPEAVYEISNEQRLLTLTEGTLECEIGGASFTLQLPNGRVVGKAYKISAKVEKDKVTVRVHHGTVLFMDGKGGRHILSGSRAVVQTVNGVTRIGAISVSDK